MRNEADKPTPPVTSPTELLADPEKTQRRLAANVAYEIRAPLTSIIGFIDALEDGVFPPEPATYDRLRAEAARLQWLIEDLTQTPQHPEILFAEHPGRRTL
jgi:signal transduction histidine kinase